MSSLLRAIALIVVLITTSLGAAGATHGETLTFKVRSTYDYTQRISFYSKTYDREWPGNGRSWVIDDYETTNYKLNCTRGERICYGAWEDDGDLHWGVGRDAEFGCTNCCWTCGASTSTRLITLSGY
jgi:hypothetical protein